MRRWGIVFAGGAAGIAGMLPLAGCGGDGGGTEVRLVAFTSVDSNAGTATITVNGETTTVDLGDASATRVVTLEDGSFDITVVVENTDSAGEAVCAIEGLGRTVETGGAHAATCEASGVIDGDTLDVAASATPDDGVVTAPDDRFAAPVDVDGLVLVEPLAGTEVDDTTVPIAGTDESGESVVYTRHLGIVGPDDDLFVTIVTESVPTGGDVDEVMERYASYARTEGTAFSAPEAVTFGAVEGLLARSDDGLSDVFVTEVGGVVLLVWWTELDEQPAGSPDLEAFVERWRAVG